MATSSKNTKTTNEKKLEKSLTDAAKILNGSIHKVPKKKASRNTRRTALTRIKIYQVWCPEDNHAIGEPTTDVDLARTTRDDHNQETNHNSSVVVSK